MRKEQDEQKQGALPVGGKRVRREKMGERKREDGRQDALLDLKYCSNRTNTG